MNEFLTIPVSEYEQMRQEIADLRSVVQQLRDEVSLLKGGKNSRTSSTSPSHDLVRSNSLILRASKGKKSGGQPGHRGHSLSLSDTPDEIIHHHVQICEHCGENLQEVDSDSFIRRQIVDIPPVFPIYIEHRAHLKTCPLCKYENRGVFPARLQSAI